MERVHATQAWRGFETPELVSIAEAVSALVYGKVSDESTVELDPVKLDPVKLNQRLRSKLYELREVGHFVQEEAHDIFVDHVDDYVECVNEYLLEVGRIACDVLPGVPSEEECETLAKDVLEYQYAIVAHVYLTIGWYKEYSYSDLQLVDETLQFLLTRYIPVYCKYTMCKPYIAQYVAEDPNTSKYLNDTLTLIGAYDFKDALQIYKLCERTIFFRVSGAGYIQDEQLGNTLAENDPLVYAHTLDRCFEQLKGFHELIYIWTNVRQIGNIKIILENSLHHEIMPGTFNIIKKGAHIALFLIDNVERYKAGIRAEMPLYLVYVQMYDQFREHVIKTWRLKRKIVDLLLSLPPSHEVVLEDFDAFTQAYEKTMQGRLNHAAYEADTSEFVSVSRMYEDLLVLYDIRTSFGYYIDEQVSMGDINDIDSPEDKRRRTLKLMRYGIIQNIKRLGSEYEKKQSQRMGQSTQQKQSHWLGRSTKKKTEPVVGSEYPTETEPADEPDGPEKQSQWLGRSTEKKTEPVVGSEYPTETEPAGGPEYSTKTEPVVGSEHLEKTESKVESADDDMAKAILIKLFKHIKDYLDAVWTVQSEHPIYQGTNPNEEKALADTLVRGFRAALEDLQMSMKNLNGPGKFDISIATKQALRVVEEYSNTLEKLDQHVQPGQQAHSNDPVSKSVHQAAIYQIKNRIGRYNEVMGAVNQNLASHKAEAHFEQQMAYQKPPMPKGRHRRTQSTKPPLPKLVDEVDGNNATTFSSLKLLPLTSVTEEWNDLKPVSENVVVQEDIHAAAGSEQILEAKVEGQHVAAESEQTFVAKVEAQHVAAERNQRVIAMGLIGLLAFV